MASYATPADLYKRHDIRLIQDLCQDDGVRPTRPAMLVDEIVEELLADASGEIEIALVSGARYTVDDLLAIQTANGNNNQVLKRMTCDICMSFMFDRRPSYKPDVAEKYRELAEKPLNRLRIGETVFNLQANVEAGLQTISPATIQDYAHMYLTVDQVGTHMYPPRNPTRLFQGQPQ